MKEALSLEVCRLSRRGGLWLWVQGPQALPGTSLSHPQHLHELLVLQVPLLDAVVPGATEQDVPLDGQTLDAVVVRGLEVVGGPDGARHALTQLKHLQKTAGAEGERRGDQALLIRFTAGSAFLKGTSSRGI